MKLISPNTWAGRAGKESLLDFFKHRKNIDVLCLQEIWEGGHHYASKWGGNMGTMTEDLFRTLASLGLSRAGEETRGYDTQMYALKK